MILTVADVDAYASVLEAVTDGVPLDELDCGYRQVAERYARVAARPWPPTSQCLDRFWHDEWERRRSTPPSRPVTIAPGAGVWPW